MTLVSREGTKPSQRDILIRTAVFTALFFPWTEFVTYLTNASVVLAAATTVPIALGLYNTWLGWRGREGLMLQDQMTSTKVIWTAGNPEETHSHVEPTGNVFRQRPVSLAILLGLVASIFLMGLFKGTSVQLAVQKSVAHDLGIRNRISLTTSFEYTPERSGKFLRISVWLPMTARQKHTDEEIMKAVLSDFSVSPGYYDGGSIEAWTGYEYAKISQTYDLQIPKTPSQ